MRSIRPDRTHSRLLQTVSVVVGAFVLFAVVALPGTPDGRVFAQDLPRCQTETPLPDGFGIASPVGEPSQASAAWFGAYEGVWDGDLPSRLIIERIDGARAHIVYTWGNEPTGTQRSGFTRFAATVHEDGSIQWGPDGSRFVFRLEGDAALGELTRQSQIFRVTMQRCSIPPVPAPPMLSAVPNVGDAIYDGPFTGPGLANTYRCPTGRVETVTVGEGYMQKVSGRCQDGQNFTNAGTGALKALQIGDGELRFEYRAVTGRDRLQLQARVRLQDHPTNSVGYVVVIQPNRGLLELRRQTAPNEGATIDARLDLAERLQTDDWVSIAASVQGPNLFVSLNDEPMLAAYDTTFDRGSVQFATIRLGHLDDAAETAVVMRNLRVSSLSGGAEDRAPWHQTP
jgi:hypothetical protein